MTTLHSMPKSRDFFAPGGAENLNQKHLKLTFSPLFLEDDKINFESVKQEKSKALIYFLKCFLFAILVFFTILSMAQQGLPESSAGRTTFIPNISKNSTSIQYEGNTATITITKLDGLKPGDRIRIYNENRESFDANVLCIRGDYFTIEGLSREKFGETVFVYGKEVYNFKTVDYDALSMMNFSLISKLSKQEETQQMQLDVMQNEINEQNTTIKQMLLLLEEQSMQITSMKESPLYNSETAILQNDNSTRESEIKGTRFIPNIFEKSSSVCYTEDRAVITMKKLDDLKPGDKVKLYNEFNESYETIVTTVNGNCFTLEKIPQEMFGETIFVYGKEIRDFRSVGL